MQDSASKKIFQKFISDYPQLILNGDDILSAFAMLYECYCDSGKVLICGNGGSAADSEHIVGELMKGFNLKRPLGEDEAEKFNNQPDGKYIASRLQGALPAISLVSQSGLITAFSNDIDPALIYAQQVYGYATEKDVLIALSTSGNSKNIVYAAQTAAALGAKVIAITGENDSLISKTADITIQLPRHTPYEVQELTLPVYHALCAMLEAEFFAQ